jgi:hypothetical protein
MAIPNLADSELTYGFENNFFGAGDAEYLS